MSDKEINIAILQELKRIANEIFTNEIDIESGTYTAAELAKEKSAKGDVIIINYIKTNNESLLTRSVCVGSFKCEFERRNIFNLIWKFEQLTGVKQKDKTRFVRIETGKADLSFSVEITKEMQSLCKCVDNDKSRPVMSYVFIDYKKGYLIASNGKHLQACKANISNVEGQTETSVLINPKDLKQLSGVCSVTVSGGKVTISDENGCAYCLECSVFIYPRWTSVVPKVSKKNYIKINESKEVLSFLKKKEGNFFMYAEKGYKVTIDYTDSSSGAFSKIEVFTKNEIPFAFSVMFDSKSFQTVAQKWDGGIFLNANYKAVVLTDKNKSLCFTMPAGTGKEGFFKMDFDFDRSNMVSLLEYGEKADAEPTTPKENIIVPVQIDPINLPVVASEYKYNAMGLYFLLSLLCDLCKAIIYHEAKEALKRLKMLLYSPAVNIEDFANEVQIIDLKPDEIEEIKEAHPITDISPGVTLPVLANVPAVPSVFFFPVVLRLVFRLWAISVSHYVPITPAKYTGCPRRGLIHIRGDTCRTTISTKRLFKLPMQISYKKHSL